MVHIKHAIVGLGLAVTLTGCEAPAEVDEVLTCPAESYQDLIGGTEENALDTLADLFLLGDSQLVVRYIGPGQAVTMDYRPDRMNIEYDEDGIVTRVTCG